MSYSSNMRYIELDEMRELQVKRAVVVALFGWWLV